MARVGWVAAQEIGVEEPMWYRLSVFDDGWVDVASGSRAAHVRSDLRIMLTAGGVLAAVIAAALLVERLPPGVGSIGALQSILGLTLLAALIFVAVSRFRIGARRVQRSMEDYDQARRLQAEGRGVTRVAESPLFTRADSAAELASWVTPSRLTRREDVAAVGLEQDGDEYLAHVRLVDGSVRTYRSPDATLHRLLAR